MRVHRVGVVVGFAACSGVPFTTGCGGATGTSQSGTDGSTGVGSSEGTTDGPGTSLPTTTSVSDPTTEGLTSPGTDSGDASSDPSTGSTSGTTDVTSTGDSTGSTTGAAVCVDCPADYKCKYDTCIPDLGPCATHDDCPGDSYCDADGECIPYDVPAGVINDPECKKENVPEGIKPSVQCEWSGPGGNDPTKNSTQIYSTPIIADLNLDKDPGKLQPSIVVTTWENIGNLGRIGTLRVFDGRTCVEQMRAGGADEPNDADRPVYGTQWAVVDLDGDVPAGGHPEIVGMHRITANNASGKANLYALRIDAESDPPQLERIWYGRDCDNDQLVAFSSAASNHGPGVIDLDDDGVPEVVMDEMVFDADGCLLSEFSDFVYTQGLGLMSVAVDVDLDFAPDLVRHDRIAGWNLATTEWEDKPWFIPNAGAHKAGHIGVADLGAYSKLEGKPTEELPEVVIVSASTANAGPNDNGTIRAQALDGSVVWGPIALYHDNGQWGGRGGPPTISDFDGDGQVEMAAAGATYYAVYDPDCVAALNGQSPPERPGGACERAPDMQGLPDGVLWAQKSQDLSSNVTGSSIFDFNGDGIAEAVYRDECYMRVYNGQTGAVIFSAPASNGTGLEYPSIADVDGDFATEIVVPRSTNGGGCPAKDPLFPASNAFAQSSGFVILRDPKDLWASSRPVWNQHAYSITHVTDDARSPKSSDIAHNWLEPGLNNFRQNSQGGLGVLLIADLTVEFADLGLLCELEGAGSKELEAEVCNRGTNPVQDGVVVRFLETQSPDQPAAEATPVCEATTSKLLLPGECEVVSCTAELGGGGNVYVIVDPEGTVADCHPGNNVGADAFAICPG